MTRFENRMINIEYRIPNIEGKRLHQSCSSCYPVKTDHWIPAFAGMTSIRNRMMNIEYPISNVEVQIFRLRFAALKACPESIEGMTK